MNNDKVINLNSIIRERIINITLADAMAMVRNNKTILLREAIKNNVINGEELCIVIEQIIRYENIDLMKWILKERKELLYYYPCDILDTAVATCNIDMIKFILEQYDSDCRPCIKYESSLDRAIINNKTEVLELIYQFEVQVIREKCHI